MNEIDNHADTICAGPNWKLLELSGEYCNVPPFPQTINRSPMSPSRNVQQFTHARRPVTLSCSSRTKCSTLVMRASLLSHKIRIKSVLMGTGSVTTRGTLIVLSESTLNPSLFHLPQMDRTYASNLGSQLIGKWTFYRPLRSLLRHGTLRIFTCLDRTWSPIVLSTVYHPLVGTIYGTNRRHRCQ